MALSQTKGGGRVGFSVDTVGVHVHIRVASFLRSSEPVGLGGGGGGGC